MGNFMAYQDRLETNLLQVFGTQKIQNDFPSFLLAYLFEVNIVDEQKRIQLVTIFFISFHCPQMFYCSPFPTKPSPESFQQGVLHLFTGG